MLLVYSYIQINCANKNYDYFNSKSKRRCWKNNIIYSYLINVITCGEKILLIDADVQRSALDWASSRNSDSIFSVVGISTNTIHKEIQLLKQNYDFIIIDGPPRVYDVARSVIAVSDVIISVQPSLYDVWSVKEVREPLQVYKKIKAAFVINKKISNSVIGCDVVDALEQYSDISVLKSTITQRVSYAETASRGTSTIEEDPESNAGKEIRNLTEE